MPLSFFSLFSFSVPSLFVFYYFTSFLSVFLYFPVMIFFSVLNFFFHFETFFSFYFNFFF